MRTYCKRQIKEYQVIVVALGCENILFWSALKKAAIDEALRYKGCSNFYDAVFVRELKTVQTDIEI